LARLGLPDDRRIASVIHGLVRRSTRILITGHERPDGDCIGSEMALCAMLRAAGHEAEIVNADPVPALYRFLLEGREAARLAPVRVAQEGETLAADLVFVLDCTSLSRTGRMEPLLAKIGAPLVDVDHHPHNPRFGAVNWVDTKAAATGELIWRLASCCGWRAPRVALDALYTAILTDTGQFAYSCTSARVHRVAAALLENGVDPEHVWQKVYLGKSRGELALDARARASLEVLGDGRIGAVTLTAEDFRATGTGKEHTENVVNIPRLLAGVELAVFFCSVSGGSKTKISLRSTRRVDAGALARRFGGGGHRQAAACLLPVPIPEARQQFLPAAESALKQRQAKG
jgi:phosphoesterase RecJ-like protein